MHAKMHSEVFDNHDVICSTIKCIEVGKEMLVYQLYNDINHIKMH